MPIEEETEAQESFPSLWLLLWQNQRIQTIYFRLSMLIFLNIIKYQ